MHPLLRVNEKQNTIDYFIFIALAGLYFLVRNRKIYLKVVIDEKIRILSHYHSLSQFIRCLYYNHVFLACEELYNSLYCLQNVRRR